jgi:hypothetical protein
MNLNRSSGSARLDTCSAETTVPWMTRMSSPASSAVLWSEAGCGDHATGFDLFDATPDEVGLHRLLIHLLDGAGRLIVRGGGDLGVDRHRIFVASPEAFEVEDGEPAETPYLDCSAGAHCRVHGRRHHREIKLVGIELPRQIHVVGVTSPS